MSDHCGHFNVVFNFRLIELECLGHTAISITPFGKKQVDFCTEVSCRGWDKRHLIQGRALATRHRKGLGRLGNLAPFL